jgi:protoporphyrinogen oxidase
VSEARRVAVLGAGVGGLVAAHELGKRGVKAHVYERWPGLGGQAATFDIGDGLALERYYHHLFTTDRHIADLYRELGMPDAIEWLPSSTAFFADGASRALNTPLDLLRFSPLSPPSRLRMGAAALVLQLRGGDVEPYEQRTARDWILRNMGRQAWDRVWGPLLRGKFGDRAEDISMAWLWSKLTLRRQIKGQEAMGEVLGYPRGGFEPLMQALAKSIRAAGGQVTIDCPAAAVEQIDGGFAVTAGAPGSFRRGRDPREYEVAGDPERYDGVVATVPNPVFEQLLDPVLAAGLAGGYLARLRAIEYHAALCLVLELDRRFSPFYWTNVADAEMPFVGLIEQTNFVDPSRYGGRHFLYVANYVAQGDPLLDRSTAELIGCYEPALRRVNPEFRRDWIQGAWLFREPDAQPIVTVGYRDVMPPLSTGVPGLVLANTTQVYPEDRGTNYAVRLGREAAGELLDGLPGAVPGR